MSMEGAVKHIEDNAVLRTGTGSKDTMWTTEIPKLPACEQKALLMIAKTAKETTMKTKGQLE